MNTPKKPTIIINDVEKLKLIYIKKSTRSREQAIKSILEQNKRP